MVKQPNFNKVLVLDTNRKPLMPCYPTRAKKLLNSGHASVFRRYPFTIILHDRTVEESQLQALEINKDQLVKIASAVNFVWNYVNDLGYRWLDRHRKFMSAYDCHEYTKGAGDELGLHSQTLQAVAETHSKSRKQFKKRKLNWRTNNPKAKRKSLGWIPFKKSAIKHVRTYQVGKGRAGLGIREWTCNHCGTTHD